MEVKLRWFQYRIIHRIISTNTFLYKIGIADSQQCTFCQDFPEKISHLFTRCRIVRGLIQEASRWLGEILNEHIALSETYIILGRPSAGGILNLLIILLKHYIYKQRAKSCLPVLIGFKDEVNTLYGLELYISKKNMN